MDYTFLMKHAGSVQKSIVGHSVMLFNMMRVNMYVEKYTYRISGWFNDVLACIVYEVHYFGR